MKYNIPFRLTEESEANSSVLRMDFIIPEQCVTACVDIGKILYYQTHKSELNIMIICAPNGRPYIGFFKELLPDLTYQL